MNSKAASVRMQVQTSRRPAATAPLDLRSPSGRTLPF